MSKEVSFIVQARAGGGNKGSILLTIPKQIVKLKKIKDKDYIKCTIKKINANEV